MKQIRVRVTLKLSAQEAAVISYAGFLHMEQNTNISQINLHI